MAKSVHEDIIDGAAAFDTGCSAETNPHPRGSIQWSRWHYGWLRASRDEPIEPPHHGSTTEGETM
jgi:hypothetical protein